MSIKLNPLVVLLLYIYILAHMTYFIMALINNNKDGDDDDKDAKEMRNYVMKLCLYSVLLFAGLIVGVVLVVSLIYFAIVSANSNNGLARTLALVLKWVWNDGKNLSMWVCLLTSMVAALVTFVVYVKATQIDYVSKLLLFIPQREKDDDDDTPIEDDSLSVNTKQKNHLIKIFMMFVLLIFFFCLGLSTISKSKKECYIWSGLLVAVAISTMFSFRYKYVIPITLVLLAVVGTFTECI